MSLITILPLKSFRLITSKGVFQAKLHYFDYLRQVSEYNRTDGYAQAVPYRDADPYDGVNPYYYEFDIALPGLPYSTSNREWVVLSFGKTVLIVRVRLFPVAVYIDDHYATFQEF